MRLRAIETFYQGYRFRSRLEARWAVFFDALGVRYEYEKEGYVLDDGTLYLPDFWLPQVGMWAEVKPNELTPEERWMCQQLVWGTHHNCLHLVGVPECKPYLSDIYIEFDDWRDGTAENIIQKIESGWYDLTAEFLNGSGCFPYNALGVSSPRFDDTINAVSAARSSRFEYGEKG